MGYISNPTGLRVGFNRNWLVKGTTDLSHHSEDMFLLFKRLLKSLLGSRRSQRLGIIFSHIVFKPGYNTHKVFVFIYDARSQQFFKKKHRNLLRRCVLLEVRSIFYQLLCKRIESFFSTVNATRDNLSLTILPLNNKSLSARAIAEFSLRKLKANNRLGEIFKPMIRGLRYTFLGLRIICCGRFTRKQRASKMIYSFGKVSLNTFKASIDYAFVDIPLKFGVGSIKIFVARKPFIL